MASAEVYYAEKGEGNSFQDKITRLFTQKMTYSIYTSKDKESYRIIIVASWAAIFIAFMFCIEEIGIFNGNLQYSGLILLFLGIVLRE